MNDAVPTRLIENDRVRVTEWKFPPDSHTGWHRHEMDYVVVPVTNGQLRLKETDGERDADEGGVVFMGRHNAAARMLPLSAVPKPRSEKACARRAAAPTGAAGGGVFVHL